MSTHCITRIRSSDKNSPIILTMYRHYDGGFETHGVELAEFLVDGTVVNGIGSNTPKKAWNGMGCLAASLIANFKNSIGGFYIYSVDSTDCWQDYEYHVYEDKVVVKNPSEVIFEGSWNDFHSFCYEDEIIED